MDLEKAIVDYCSNTSEFTLKEIENSLANSSKHNQYTVSDYLEFCSLAFRSLANTKNDKYLSRHCFFKGIKFRIVLSDLEIKNSILIPGHRFVPFYYSDLFPSEFTILDAKTQAPILKKKITQPVESLFEYYYMFGADTISDQLTAEDKTNLKVVGKDPKGMVKINVFDLKAIQSSHKLKAFNSLLLEVVDWTNGIFTAELHNAESPAEKEESHIFAEEIESALYKVFEKFGPYPEVSEQLGWAYFLADIKKLKDPIISLEEAFVIAENIELKYFENNTVLWFKSDDGASWQKHHSHKNKDLFSLSSGNISSIDAIFDDLRIPFTTREIALFLSAYRSKHNNCSEFIADVLTDKIKFKDKAQDVIFHNLLDELFENSKNDGFTLPKSKHSDIIHNGINRLKKISKSYSHKPLSANHSQEESFSIYKDIKENIGALSSVLSFYCNNPHSLQEIERLSDFEKYIDDLFKSIEIRLAGE
ncbi:MAG: hypothetical protein WCR55_00145 [Lentisphaerota bacterium]